MFEVKFVTTQERVSSNIPHLRVGLINRQYPVVVASVSIENVTQPVMIIDVFGNPDDYFFTKSALLWKQYLVVGVGHQVTIINLDNYETTTTDLGCYFGDLYPVDNWLLVASARDLHCFADTGKLQWTSKELGIDGVIVKQVSDEIINGVGEWDPQGGWKPFKLNLATGK